MNTRSVSRKTEHQRPHDEEPALRAERLSGPSGAHRFRVCDSPGRWPQVVAGARGACRRVTPHRGPQRASRVCAVEPLLDAEPQGNGLPLRGAAGDGGPSPGLAGSAGGGKTPPLPGRTTGRVYPSPGQSSQVAAQDTRPQSRQGGDTLRPGAPHTGPGGLRGSAADGWPPEPCWGDFSSKQLGLKVRWHRGAGRVGVAPRNVCVPINAWFPPFRVRLRSC